jgi:hypothetical protein
MSTVSAPVMYKDWEENTHTHTHTHTYTRVIKVYQNHIYQFNYTGNVLLGTPGSHPRYCTVPRDIGLISPI